MSLQLSLIGLCCCDWYSGERVCRSSDQRSLSVLLSWTLSHKWLSNRHDFLLPISRLYDKCFSVSPFVTFYEQIVYKLLILLKCSLIDHLCKPSTNTQVHIIVISKLFFIPVWFSDQLCIRHCIVVH